MQKPVLEQLALVIGLCACALYAMYLSKDPFVYFAMGAMAGALTPPKRDNQGA